jgi:integrase
MQAEPSARTSTAPEACDAGYSQQARILRFPQRQEPAGDPATTLRAIVAALGPAEARRLAEEINLLHDALAGRENPVDEPSAPEGLRPRHSSWCRAHSGCRCNCEPSWEASVYLKGERKKLRKTFSSRREALSWRRERLPLVDAGRLRTPSPHTLAEAACSWIAMAQSGEIVNRSGRPYKPSALRTIEQDLRLRLIPELGAHRMGEIARVDLQRRVGTWLAQGLSPSKVHASVNAARVLFRDFDLISGTENPLAHDPTRGLRLPAVTGRRDRIATPDEARRLIAALEHENRALWATAMYAGVRHGELRALRVDDIDLEHRRINIRRGWDQYEGEIDTKSERGRRSTVIIGLLRDLLASYLKLTGRAGDDLIFGRSSTRPFATNTVNARARRAWEAARRREDAEERIPVGNRIRPIGLHECRHTAVSQMLDAGVTIDKVSKFMGHASITITIDRYGHLLPGGEAEAAALIDAYQERRRGR